MNITFTITTEVLETAKLIVDGVEQDVNNIKYTYTPDNAGLSTKWYCLSEKHNLVMQEEKRAHFLDSFYKEWLVEAGYNTQNYKVEPTTGEVIERGKVKTQAEVDKWLKPNATNELSPTTAEEI